MEKTRVSVYMPVSTKQRLDRMADRLNKKLTEVSVLSIEAGLDLLELSFSKDFAVLVAENPTMIAELQRMAYEAANRNKSVEPD